MLSYSSLCSSRSSANLACLPGTPLFGKKALLARPVGAEGSSSAIELPAGAFSFSMEKIPIGFLYT